MTTDSPKLQIQDAFRPERCEHCGQSLSYLIPIDRGSVDILKAISQAIRKKGINIVHPRKEMEAGGRDVSYKEMVREGHLTSNQVGNLSRLRFHGLIASVDGNPGNYCLTSKGAEFLKGGAVPRYAVISKVTGHQIGYHMPEKYRVVIYDFRPDQEYWDGIDYQIVAGRVMVDLPKDPSQVQASLFQPLAKAMN